MHRTWFLLLLLLAGCVGSQSPSSSPGEAMSFRLPSNEFETPLLRTDGARPDRWESLLVAIRTPNPSGFLAYVAVFTDPALVGLTEEEIRGLPRAGDAERFVLVADERALADDEFPILVVDISDDGRPSFRVTASCLWSVENNLSLANMDWEEFADATDADGTYRLC